MKLSPIILPLLFAALAPCAAKADITTGLKLWLRVDEGAGTNVADSSGNNHPGTLTGGPTWTSGQIGNAVDLAGDDDRIVVTHHADFNSSHITVAMWIKPDDWMDDFDVAISKQEASSPYPSWDLRKTPGAATIEAVITVGGIPYTAVSGTSITTGSWQHVAFTYDGETLKVYRNATFTVGTENTAPSGGLATTTTDIWVGGHPGVSGRFLEGAVDDIRIYSRALTASDITELYNWRGTVPRAMHYARLRTQ